MNNNGDRSKNKRKIWQYTLCMKQVIDDRKKNSYKNLNVATVDREEWKAVKVI